MQQLINDVRACTFCASYLPNAPKPIVSLSEKSKILIIGQAPGQKVQDTGIPWNDQSGKELRRWLGVDSALFYNSDIFGIMPMGFCFPGTGKNGDLPPRPECAPTWHHLFLAQMPHIQLTLLIGQYAQKYYLKEKFSVSLTENVRNYADFLPRFLPLVHPSPRNKIWHKINPWFETDIIPALQKIVRANI